MKKETFVHRQADNKGSSKLWDSLERHFEWTSGGDNVRIESLKQTFESENLKKDVNDQTTSHDNDNQNTRKKERIRGYPRDLSRSSSRKKKKTVVSWEKVSASQRPSTDARKQKKQKKNKNKKTVSLPRTSHRVKLRRTKNINKKKRGKKAWSVGPREIPW